MKKVVTYLIKAVLLALGYLIPRNRRKIVFGAWCGWSYSDNPRYLFEFLFDKPEWRIVWVGGDSVRANLPILPRNASYCRMGSLRSVFHLLSAGTWIFSHSVGDLTLLPLWGRCLIIDTGHGAALKRLGVLKPSHSSGKETAKCCLSTKRSPLMRMRDRMLNKKIFQVAPSLFYWRMIFDGYPGMFQTAAMLFGSPTLDYIIKNKSNSNYKAILKAEIAQRFSLPQDKKWIVYAPTFRWTVHKNFTFLNLDNARRNRLDSVLEKKNAIIVEKLHPGVIKNGTSGHVGSVYSINGVTARSLSPHALWLAADMLISDYSSCVIDFHMQDKPVIHYAYDLDYYVTEDSGLIHNLDDVKFGPIVKTIDDLVSTLDGDWASFRNIKGILIRDVIEHEDGHSCEKYLEFIEQRHGLSAMP